MIRTNQGGSMINFLLIGGAMALLLIGGAYVVRRNFAPADRNSQVAVSEMDEETEKKEPSDGKVPSDSDKKQEEQSGSTRNDTGTDTSKDVSTLAPDSSGQPSGDLPTTGPSSLALTGIMLGSLAGILTAYLQSRRQYGTL